MQGLQSRNGQDHEEMTSAQILHEPGGPYIFEGHKYPGVTTILESLFRRACTAAEDRDYYLERGSAVHKDMYLEWPEGNEKSRLDYEALDPSIKPFIKAARIYRNLNPFEVIMAGDPECKGRGVMVSKKWGYGCTLDYLVRYQGAKTMAVVDIKSGVSAPELATALQTAAQRNALAETAGIKKGLLTTQSLLLTPDGKAVPKTYKNPDTAFQGFLHYRACYQLEVNAGLRKPWN
jgi:hypothetical protein